MTEGNKITRRDPKTGRILPGGKILSGEEATSMVQKRWDKPLKEDTEDLILEAGYQNTKDCPTDFRLLCERAAGGDVRSIIEYGRRVGRYSDDNTEYSRPSPGEICPTCKQAVLDEQKKIIAGMFNDLTPEEMNLMRALLDRVRKTPSLDLGLDLLPRTADKASRGNHDPICKPDPQNPL